MSDRISEMEVFACIIDHGSLSGAGRKLGMSPSAISRTLNRLELRLGSPLAVRSSRRLRLTPEGEAYYHQACAILAQVEKAERDVRQSAGRVGGVLRVSSTVPFAIHIVAPLIERFLDQYPDIRIEFDIQDDPVDLIFERTDVAIRSGELADSSMIARRLLSSPRHIVGSPEYLERNGTPQRPKDLHSHNCLVMSGRRWSARWPFRDGVSASGCRHVEVSGNLTFNNGESLRDFALRGAGLARLSEFHIGKDVTEGRLVTVLDAKNPGDLEPISAVYPAQNQVPIRVRKFIDFLAQNL